MAPSISRTNRPPWRRHQFRTYGHGDSPVTAHPRYSTAEHALIARRKRNCAFGDEAQTSTSAALPPSCRALSNLRRAMIVAVPSASGGTIPAAGDRRHWRVGLVLSRPTPNAYAALFHRTTYVGTSYRRGLRSSSTAFAVPMVWRQCGSDPPECPRPAYQSGKSSPDRPPWKSAG